MDRAVRGPRTVALLVNPAAGKGSGARTGALAAARLRDAGFVVTEVVGDDGAHAERLLADAVADGVDAVVACGGDGTVNHALQAVVSSGVPLGVVPCGTGNDVARYLSVPERDPAAAVDRVIASRTRRLDVAACRGRYFLTVMAAGFDAVVNERANAMTWPRGQMRYNLATVAELRTFRPLDYTIEVDGEVLRTTAMLVAVGNGPSFGGGLRIAEGASLTDGLLDVVVIAEMSKPRLLRLYPKLFSGTHTSAPEFRRLRGRRVTVASPGIVAYADGERWGPLPLSVESVPAALEVFA